MSQPVYPEPPANIPVSMIAPSAEFRFIATSILLFTCLTGAAQQKRSADLLPFDVARFEKTMTTVEWLCKYDAVAWWTSDSVMAQSPDELSRLGAEWFCYEGKKDEWHAIYGKYVDDRFDMVFHFLVDTKGRISRLHQKPDTSLLHPYARAIVHARKDMEGVGDSIGYRFNQYVRRNKDGRFDVWIFPAFQTDGTAVYGAEYHYILNATGNTILRKDAYRGKIQAIKANPSGEVILDNSQFDHPSMGAVFFVWYYKEYFRHITIQNKETKTTVFKRPDGTFYWVHADRKNSFVR
ncbi:MAG: hypothetical protein EOO01_11620 [Chitinophagaceae bacterium]|nr:MAG: hypothetical protein EOO01_11620 [Chitinophagaceae bacterium]